MKCMRIGLLIVFVLQFIAISGAAPAEDLSVVASVEQRTQLRLTLYQNGLALVDESRTISLSRDADRIVVAGVSPRLIPGSARFTASGRSVRALDYRLGGLSPRALLAAFVGKQVGIIQTHPTTGEETTIRAQVLSVAEGVVLRIADRIETGIPGRMVFDDVPTDLENSPAVVALISPGKAHDGVIDLQYLSDGLGWRADHIVNVTETSSQITLDMESWANIENNTGVAFNDASIALVAGNVNRMSQSQPQQKTRMESMAITMADAPAMGQPSREVIGDFHLYDIAGTFNLGNPARIQVLLDAQKNIAAEKAYVLKGHGQTYFGRAARDAFPTEHPEILYRFDNSSREPLAGGVVRLYGVDKQGIKRFLGEDHVPSTAAGEAVEIHSGQAFDLSARRRQLSFERRGTDNNLFETSHEITLRNVGARVAVIEVREQAFGDWEILDSSHMNERDGMTAVWRITVAPAGETTLTYRILIER